MKRDLSPQATILEPLYLEYPEATGFAAEQLDQLKADRDQVDLYLITGNAYPQYPGCLIGEMFLRPVAMIGGYVNWEMSARLRSKGLEGYSPADMGELNELISNNPGQKILPEHPDPDRLGRPVQQPPGPERLYGPG